MLLLLGGLEPGDVGLVSRIVRRDHRSSFTRRITQSGRLLTDPNAFQPDLPLSFRDAYSLVLRKGGYLGRESQIALANRLRSVPSAKVSRQVRRALNRGRTDEERIALVIEVLDEAGITAPPPREPLPDIEEHEVRLVTWMAVHGTRSLHEAAE